ncbi:MAG: isoprenylcysteine carboxylmethyltransferase family protein [Alteromonadaceae bacterium]|nr:isoprenylcysteine carboxylmethyltransferase family protein [Alteromonadaceae bacterium]
MNHPLELKIIPVIQVAIAAVLMFIIAKIFPVSQGLLAVKWFIWGIFIAIGLLFGLTGIISFRLAKTTVNPSKPNDASSLVQTGIYRVTRNPMYVGLVCVLIAWAAWLGSVYSLSVVIVFMLYMSRFQILPEERALIEIFGDKYIDYCLKVSRWL